MEIVLALDVGSTRVRAVAFDRALTPLVAATRDLPTHHPHPDHVEHDPAAIVALAVATLVEVGAWAREGGHRVLALGLTNQRETTVAFDRANGRALAPAISWRDRRTEGACAALRARGLEPLIRERTGLVLDPYFSATKMAWLVEHGVLESARLPALATLDSWLLWHLSGGVEGGLFATEPSNASRTMLFDLVARTWSAPQLELFGLDETTLADVRPSSGPFAVVRHRDLADLAGVAITGVLGDQQAALFGQACYRPGLAKATYGTGAFVLANAGANAPAPIAGLLTSVAWDLGANGVAYALEGSAFVAGAAIDWLVELGLLESAAQLDALARSVDDAGGVSFVPAFHGLGSPFWRGDLRGAILGLRETTGRAHVARATVEALVFQVRAITDTVRAGGVELTELRLDGGACAIDLLVELQASASHLRVARAASVEATARGAAAVAALGAGVVTSLEELADSWRGEPAREPPPDEPLEASYRAWRAAIDRL